ncbi:TPA_asm: maturation protein [ssRNA phage SRR7976325_22]|uniref:Maturation protein n=1 Tax=ssRNA phage SRR7976325_22 TaxID=2786710 RepID=A0A8S5L1G8_9VIRU|nr:maturation protein [ssRNA phage SRR7976325_22]DAD51197.1 TPA_asm: maturation protein [ssRNA phage SRR7976325_22]
MRVGVDPYYMDTTVPTYLETYYSAPFDASESPYGKPGFGIKNFVYKQGWRTLPGEPKDQVLSYEGRIARGRATVVQSDPWWKWYYSPGPFGADHPYTGNSWMISKVPSYAASTYNRAYERFIEVARGPSATLGATVAEGRDALELIGDRAAKMYKAYKALRRGRFKRFLAELGVNPKRKHRKKIRAASHEASGLWLEYHFGWSPLAGELYDATVALTAGRSTGKFVGRASCMLPERTESYSTKSVRESGRYVARIGANVEVSSYNSLLVQQMGLANPLAIAWEVVPFSFVVDWFTNVGDVLGAVSDLYGLTLTNSYQTQYVRTKSRFSTTSEWDWYGGMCWYEYNMYAHRRTVGLPRPVLIYPKVGNFGTSMPRAATAVSLLVALFTGDK